LDLKKQRCYGVSSVGFEEAALLPRLQRCT